MIYRLVRSILFLFPAETAHHIAMNMLKGLCAVPFLRKTLASIFTPRHSPLTTHPFGLSFKNPVGLGAGFDKNARYLRELETLGFGFVEIGTVTPKPQAGNDKPRLFRLKKDEALINRMGFNNDGVDVIAERLKARRLKEEKEKKKDINTQQTANNYHLPSAIHPLVIGGNIGKNKTTPNDEAWKDYEICFTALYEYVDFFVVNVSSPNTPGLRELQEKEALKRILTHLQTLRKGYPVSKPILLKIAPDLTLSQIDDVIDLAKEINLDGLVATNTTINREGLIASAAELSAIGAGGLSGKPLRQRSTEIVQYISQKTGGTLPIIGSGGIFSHRDAAEKLKAGASLVEVWTGFIYEGPFIIKDICKGLNP